MTGACFYDEFVKILTRLHLLLHKSPLEVGAAVLVQLPFVVILCNVENATTITEPHIDLTHCSLIGYGQA